MTDATVSVSFTASAEDLIAGVGDAKDALTSLAGSFDQIRAQASTLASAAAEAFDASRPQSFNAVLVATTELETSLAQQRARAAAAKRAGDDAAYADALRAAQLATGEEIKVVEDGARQKLALYNEEFRLYAITSQQKLSLSLQTLDAERAAEVAALQQQAAFGEQSQAAQQRLHNAILNAELRHLDAVNAATRTAIAEQQRAYESFADSVAQSFNSQLHGLLSGTTNWRTAFSNILEDLLIKFIEWSEATVIHHLAAEAAKTSATVSAVAARTGAEEAGATSSMAAQGAAAIRSILSSAAETFAGVFGFLAPLMGPFAIGPAAAAEATVAGMAGSVASADIGMWRVPQDMLTLVHHNELVMPAAQAGAFRSLLSEDENPRRDRATPVHVSPTTHFHISAVDSGSVAQWLRSNASTMMRQIDEAVRHGAHLGLRRLGA